MKKWGQETQVRGKNKRKEYVPEPEMVRVLDVQTQNNIQGRDSIASQMRRKCLAVVDTRVDIIQCSSH